MSRKKKRNDEYSEGKSWIRSHPVKSTVIGLGVAYLGYHVVSKFTKNKKGATSESRVVPQQPKALSCRDRDDYDLLAELSHEQLRTFSNLILEGYSEEKALEIMGLW